MGLQCVCGILLPSFRHPTPVAPKGNGSLSVSGIVKQSSLPLYSEVPEVRPRPNGVVEE